MRENPAAAASVRHAVAEATRREAIRRSSSDSEPEDSPNPEASLRCIDVFELRSTGRSNAHSVYVVVVERVAVQPSAGSSSEWAERFGLTPREAEVARGLVDRLSSAEIAAGLGISVNTVRRHSERVLEKLGVGSRREVRKVLRPRDEYD